MLNGDYMVSSVISDAEPIVYLSEIKMINFFCSENSTIYKIAKAVSVYKKPHLSFGL